MFFILSSGGYDLPSDRYSSATKYNNYNAVL